VKRKFPNKKKRLCYNCGSTEHLVAHCPYEIKDNNYKRDKKESKTDYKKSKRHMEEAHIGHEWDSTKDNSSEEDEKIATVVFTSHPPHQGFSTTYPMMITTPLTFVLWQRVRR
jgi:tRNA(Leu) C34 or U34 (ribose-2'-O)-methylase TrmL